MKRQFFIFLIIGFLLICLIESEAILVTPPSGQQSITWTLLTGWNMVSCPGTPTVSSWSTILSGNSALFQFAFAYNTTTGGFNIVSTLEFGKAYLVRANQNTQLTIQYLPLETFNSALKTNWNTIGSVSGIVPASHIKKDPTATALLVFRLNAITQGFTLASDIVPGTGYLVRSSADCQATVPTPFFPLTPFSPPAFASGNSIWEGLIRVKTERSSHELVFGMHSSASDGFDVSLDVPSFPELPDIKGNVFWIVSDPNMPNLSYSYVKETPHAVFELLLDLAEPKELQWSRLPKPYRFVLLYDGQIIKMDQAGSLLLPSGKKSVKVVLDTLDSLPLKTQLLANYPNPFNPETWIPYELSKDTNVKIMIYSLNGQLVRKLDLGHKLRGSYVEKGKSVYWDGKNEAGEKVNSGIYFYALVTPDFSQTRKFVIMR